MPGCLCKDPPSRCGYIRYALKIIPAASPFTLSYSVSRRVLFKRERERERERETDGEPFMYAYTRIHIVRASSYQRDSCASACVLSAPHLAGFFFFIFLFLFCREGIFLRGDARVR